MWRDRLWIHGPGASPPWVLSGPAGFSHESKCYHWPLAVCGAQDSVDSWLGFAICLRPHGNSPEGIDTQMFAPASCGRMSGGLLNARPNTNW